MRYRPEETPVYIVTTAAEGGANNKYVALARAQFLQLGFSHIQYLDLRIDSLPQATGHGILYVAGGNTYTMFAAARSVGLDTWLRRASNWLYIGVSAGAIILGKSLLPAARLGDDAGSAPKDEPAFRLVDADIFVHYEGNWPTGVKQHRAAGWPIMLADGQVMDVAQAAKLALPNALPR